MSAFDGFKKRDFEEISVINFANRKIDSINLSSYEHCLNLKVLHLENNKLKKLDFRKLKKCTKIEEIFLSNNQIEEIELAHFPNLKTLNLYNNKFPSINLEPLRNCSKLTFLNLFYNKLEVINLQPLENCTSLEKLSVGDNNLSKINLSPLKDCNNLKALRLDENQLEEIDLRALECHKRFESLQLSDNKLQSIDLSPFSIEQCTTDSESEEIHQLSGLYLGKNQLSTIDISPLVNYERFYHLSLNNNRLEEIDLSPLSKCKELRSVDLSYNRLKKLDLSPLNELPELNTLYLTNNPTLNLDLSVLMDCPKLERVYTYGVKSLSWSKKEPHFKHPLYYFYEKIQQEIQEEKEKAEEEAFQHDRVKNRQKIIHSYNDMYVSDLNATLSKMLRYPDRTIERMRYRPPDSYVVESIIDILATKGNADSVKHLMTLIEIITNDYYQEFTGRFQGDVTYGFSLRDPEQNWFVCFEKAVKSLFALNKDKAIMKLTFIYSYLLLLDTDQINSTWFYPTFFGYTGDYSLYDVVYLVNSFAEKITDKKFISGIRDIVDESLEQIFKPNEHEDYSLELYEYYVTLLQNDVFLKDKPKYLLIFLLQLLEKNEGIEVINEIRDKFKSLIKSD